MRGLIVAAGLVAMSSMAGAVTSVSCTSVANCSNALLSLPSQPLPTDGGSNTTNTAWFELGGVVTYSLGEVKSLRDMSLFLDSDDTYSIQTSLNGSSWTNLVTVSAAVGNVASGMERFSSVNIGPFAATYESTMDFAPVNAAFIRVQGVGTCNGRCAVGAAVFLTQTATPVPEPATWALMLGGVAAVLARRRRPQR